MKYAEDQTKSMTMAGLNLIGQALSIYDRDLKLVICNAPFQTIFDLPESLVTPGATFRDTITHLAERGEYGEVDDLETFVQERIEQARAFEPHYMERTRANGRTISVEGSPLAEGGWVTVYTDISATKAQEALLRARSDALSDQVLAHTEKLSQTNRELAAMITALEEAKRQLTAAEARARLTTEMMPAHIAHVDAAGHYTYSNQRLSTIIPNRPSNILGRHIREVLGPDNHDSVFDALNSAYSGTPAVQEFTDPNSARRIRTAFTPDRADGVYILSMDVTEETQTRAALQQTHRRALAAQITSGLAHDFSNLLTIILGLQSRLGRLPNVPSGAAPLIEGTLTAARRGGTLLSSIAQISDPRSLRPTATDISAMMKDLVTLAEPTLPQGTKLSLKVDDIGVVLLDRGLLQDGLLNLILNARDAMGAEGDITLSVRRVHDTRIEFQVQDTGPGFSETALKQGLDPFFTTKGAEGSGLGLPMVYDTTKLAGGDLKLANTAEGARVTLWLPYREPVPATTGLALLVEDRDDLRAVLRDMLMEQGYSVIEAVSADEAAALLADLPDITLILSDLQLEGEATGIDLAKRLGTASPPIVLMTSLPSDAPLFLEAQQHAPVLRKPFTSDDLSMLIIPQQETSS
ncbi:PAS-domain containing protein [Sulfitobacter donghicola]|uniref:histidine kinase n=1 Tax=Sulfitobacter donghicola DSW-25 = KCTC 12864 = JCM 14565 TaxID=1300350 RepID=A0A073IJ58_9RHOB|nr:PAS-domain containing protein [Sulfitobacter donghicola]KEJ90363.1 PAS sensor protein [Sulfitobacter donghicola DSW-25 = KCTC 12864 = JCM 14565]